MRGWIQGEETVCYHANMFLEKVVTCLTNSTFVFTLFSPGFTNIIGIMTPDHWIIAVTGVS